MPTDVWIAFGYRGQGAPPDPILQSGSQALLIADAIVHLEHTQILAESGCGTQLNIPNDSNLDGLILLFQFVFQSSTNPSEVAVSDVFGTTIWPSSSIARATTRSGRGARRSAVEAARVATQRWAQDPKLRISTEKAARRAALMQILARGR